MLHIKLKGMKLIAVCKHKVCPYTHPMTPGEGSSGQKNLKVVMLHAKFKGMELRAPCKHIFCPYTHP